MNNAYINNGRELRAAAEEMKSKGQWQALIALLRPLMEKGAAPLLC